LLKRCQANDYFNKEALAASNAYSAVGDSFSWTNLSTFYRNGGKLIFYHGVSDPWFSAVDTVEYYRNVIKDNGGADKVSEWCRLFLDPKYPHYTGKGDSKDAKNYECRE